MDKLDPMQNQLCRVCDEPAAGFHFGAFTCEGCKSFFGRTCNNQSVIQECKNNYRCVINKKNRTACKACRLRKCLMVGMSKSGSRYGRRSNWFKIHCLMQQATEHGPNTGRSSVSSPSSHERPSHFPSHGTSIPSRTTTHSLGSPPLWRPLDSPSPKASPPPAPLPPSSMPTIPSKVQPPSASSFNFLPSVLGASSPKAKEALEAASRSTPITSSPMVTSVAASAAAAAMAASSPFTFPTSLYSPFGNALPFLPPTFNLPGISTLPLHKQALLSPLLASSHFLAAARKAYPFLGATPPSETASPPATEASASTADVLAEHKALLERFRASAAAMAAAAVLNNNKDEDEKSSIAADSVKEESIRSSASPPTSASGPPLVNKDGTIPMDLTKRSSSEDSVSSVGSEIIPNLSDTDEEDQPEVVDEQPQQQKRKESESLPLDLTCV